MGTNFLHLKNRRPKTPCHSRKLNSGKVATDRENVVKKSEFDKMLRVAINTPPLKLRKEKEEKERNSKDKKDSE